MHLSLRSKINISISLLLIFAVGLTLFVSIRSSVRAASPLSDSVDWMMFGYNAAHTSYNPLETTITPSNVSQLTPDWQVATNLADVSSEVEANGIVYVASDKLYALNASTGATIWTLTLPFTVSPTTPAVVNGVVYVDRNTTLYALNAATGATVWTVTIARAFDTSPTVADGLVYVGTQNGKLYAYKAATGKRHWVVQMAGGNMLGGTAVANGIVYADSGGIMYALDARTGATKWTFTANAGSDITPTIANGLVYFGTGGSLTGSTFYALNASTGTEVWSFQENRETASFVYGLAVAKGIAYIPTFDGYLYAVDALTGVQHWTVYLGNNSLTAPTVANGVVYVGVSDGKQGQDDVFAFDARGGKQL